MRGTWVTVICILAGFANGQSFEDQVSQQVTAVSPVTVLGYGGLTIGLDSRGTISVCRWPEPGSPNHLSYSSNENKGLEWGVVRGAERQWLSHEEWRSAAEPNAQNPNVLRWRFKLENSRIEAVVTTLIHPRKSLLATRIQVDGLEPGAKLIWRSAFAPVTTRPAELIYPTINRGFASYVDTPGKFWRHFRPDQLDREMVARRDQLQDSKAGMASWETFSDGVWIESWVGSRHEIERTISDQDADPSTPLEIEIKPSYDGTTHTAVVFTVFGETSEELNTFKETVMSLSFSDLLSLTKKTPLVHRKKNSSDEVDTAELVESIFRHTSVDKSNVVRTIANESFAEKNWPMWGAQMALGMNAAGFQKKAHEIIDSYLDGVRINTSETNETHGSMPMAVYADGSLAAPHFAIEFHSPAWVAFAVRQLGESLPRQQQRAYWHQRYPFIGSSGDFLANWGGRYPLHPSMYLDDITMDSAELRFESNAASWLGLSSVMFIADQIGMPIPHRWQMSRRNLESQLRKDFNSEYDHLMLISGKYRYSDEELDQLQESGRKQLLANNPYIHWRKTLQYITLARNYRRIPPVESAQSFQLLERIGYTLGTKRDVPDYLDGLMAAHALRIVFILKN